MVNIKLLIEKELNELWEKYSEFEFTNIPPLAPKEIYTKDSILFIGLNPSLSKTEIERIKNNSVKEMEFYENHRNSNEIHRYFKKFVIISENTGLSWEHLDLLYIRETQQNKVKEILKTENGKNFIFEQLKISDKIMQHIIEFEKPKMVVVNNTLSREFLGKNNHWLNYNFEPNENIGTQTYKNIPFFFTSMLTGQRALDIGSFERLIWHINYIKEK